MTASPYDPPRTPVADPPPPPKPRQVRLAAGLIWASLALGVVNFLLEFGPDSIAPGFEEWIIAGATLGVLGLLAALVSQGRNAARIAYAVLFAIGTLPSLLLVEELFTRSTASGSVALAQMILQAAALVLLFTRPAAAWFRRGGLQ